MRAVIITGAGRAFSAGQDLGEAQSSSFGPGERIRRYYNPNIRAIRALDKVVIAAVNGVAAGAGVGLALACDIRIAAERASFVPAFVGIGLVPDSGLSWTATRLLGQARAFDWLVSGRRLTAQEALAWGLVSDVVDDAVAAARERARVLAGAPGAAIGLTKRLMNAAVNGSLDTQLELERQFQQFASEDPAYMEQIAAFLEKQAGGVAR